MATGLEDILRGSSITEPLPPDSIYQRYIYVSTEYDNDAGRRIKVPVAIELSPTKRTFT